MKGVKGEGGRREEREGKKKNKTEGARGAGRRENQ
jgi:hypothetical protein